MHTYIQHNNNYMHMLFSQMSCLSGLLPISCWCFSFRMSKWKVYKVIFSDWFSKWDLSLCALLTSWRTSALFTLRRNRATSRKSWRFLPKSRKRTFHHFMSTGTTEKFLQSWFSMELCRSYIYCREWLPINLMCSLLIPGGGSWIRRTVLMERRGQTSPDQ